MVTKSILTKIVDIKTQYELYVKDINLNIERLKKELEIVAAKKDKYYSIVSKYKEYINTYYKEDYYTLIRSNNKDILLKNENVKEKPLISIYLNNIIDCNKQQESNRNQIQIFKNKKISFKMYKTIIDKGNTKVIDAIIYENYFFCPNKSFGAIAIMRSESEKLKINWNESNKKKQRIIDSGGVPYYAKDHKQALKEKKEYKGVRWLIYFDKTNYFFNWIRNSYIRNRFPITKDYVMVPIRSTHYTSPVKKLAEIKKDAVKTSLLYTRKEFE